ncbi:hypothetical protein PT2222_20340 [Paraburkholderia tropica]
MCRPASRAERQQGVAQDVDSLVDVFAIENELGRDDRAVAGRLQVQARVVELALQQMAASSGLAVRLHVDSREHPVAAYIGDDGQFGQRCDLFEEIAGKRLRAFEQALVAINVERGECGGARDRMRGPGIAVEELDRAVRGAVHNRVVDVIRHSDGRHRHGAVGDRLGHGDEIGRHAETLRRERFAGAPEAADHLVEYQQNAVRRADFAQPFEIAFGRNQHAGRSRNRFDDTGCDVFRAVEKDEAQQVVREFAAVFGLARDVTVFLQPGIAHVHDAMHDVAECPPVVDHAGQRDAAEIHAVIRALARHEHRTARRADRALISEADFHRGIDRLGTRTDEEQLPDALRQHLRKSSREFERLWMGAQEARRKVERQQLRMHGFGDFGAAMSGGRREQARPGVENRPPVQVVEVLILRAPEHLRGGFEFAVRRERQPLVLQGGRSGGERGKWGVRGVHDDGS